MHFIEHGQILQELTQSQLVVKTMQLARNCQDFTHIINARILKQMSVFLRELSNDNSFVKALELDSFAPIVENAEVFTVTPDNVDFYWNLLEFHFNCAMEREGSIGVYTRLDFYLGKIGQLFGPGAQENDPVTFFRANFLAKYKLTDALAKQNDIGLTISEEEHKNSAAAMQDEDDEDEENLENAPAEDEDMVAKTEP